MTIIVVRNVVWVGGEVASIVLGGSEIVVEVIVLVGLGGGGIEVVVIVLVGGSEVVVVVVVLVGEVVVVVIVLVDEDNAFLLFVFVIKLEKKSQKYILFIYL